MESFRMYDNKVKYVNFLFSDNYCIANFLYFSISSSSHAIEKEWHHYTTYSCSKIFKTLPKSLTLTVDFFKD